jgi:hypothetical protein
VKIDRESKSNAHTSNDLVMEEYVSSTDGMSEKTKKLSENRHNVQKQERKKYQG